jgi:hypothetical protein
MYLCHVNSRTGIGHVGYCGYFEHKGSVHLNMDSLRQGIRDRVIHNDQPPTIRMLVVTLQIWYIQLYAV